MAKLQIIVAPDERLKKKAMHVEKFDEALKAFAQDMIETSILEKGSLASLQVPDDPRFSYLNILENYRKQPNIIIMAHEDNELFAAINAHIIEASEEKEISHEMCFSIPNLLVKVQRHKSIKIKYQDLEGNEHIKEHKNRIAAAWQHEIDHQNGIITLDRISAMAQALMWKKFNQINHSFVHKR